MAIKSLTLPCQPGQNTEAVVRLALASHRSNDWAYDYHHSDQTIMVRYADSDDDSQVIQGENAKRISKSEHLAWMSILLSLLLTCTYLNNIVYLAQLTYQKRHLQNWNMLYQLQTKNTPRSHCARINQMVAHKLSALLALPIQIQSLHLDYPQIRLSIQCPLPEQEKSLQTRLAQILLASPEQSLIQKGATQWDIRGSLD